MVAELYLSYGYTNEVREKKEIFNILKEATKTVFIIITLIRVHKPTHYLVLIKLYNKDKIYNI